MPIDQEGYSRAFNRLIKRNGESPTHAMVIAEMEDEALRTAPPIDFTKPQGVNAERAPESTERIVEMAWHEQERILIDQATHIIRARMANSRATHLKNLIPVITSINVTFDIDLWSAVPEGKS